MRARHCAKLLGARDAGEAHEVAHGVLVGAPGVRVGQVGEPLDLGGHVGEPVKLGGRQQPAGRRGLGQVLGFKGDDCGDG
jgi:hypothetical protein